MSTHFYPRPETARTISPARPSTARSTIRAITPSPPGSLDDAPRLQLTAPPVLTHHDLQPEPQKADCGRPKSEYERGKSSAEHMTNSRYDFGFMGSSFDSPGTGMRRGGTASGRSSPVKKRARSHSPLKRPFPSPVLPAAKVPASQEQHAAVSTWHSTTEDDIEEETDGFEQDGPETPTPMSREQRSRAYTPLGVPAPLFSTRHGKRKHGVDDERETPSLQGPLTYVRQHKHTRSQPTSSDRNFKSHGRDMISAARIQERVPDSTYAQTTPPVKSPSALDPRRHASTSARSNVSGGTVTSKHSVFSTPGRDELERKKATIEIDEGPFARAVSVQDLDARRRQVSALSEEIHYDKEKRRRKRDCGIGGRCSVM